MKTFEDVVGFHGHACPGLAMGYRVSVLALNEMGKGSEDEELVAVVENDSCAVDAVQVMTECTFGKGNLLFRDYGKQVYTFIRRPGGRALRVSVKWVSPPESDDERLAWERYANGDRTEKVVSVVHDRKARKIRAVMDAPDGDLFDVTRPDLTPPMEAVIYPSVRCGICSEKVMEPRARVRDGIIVCIPCFDSPAVGDGRR